MAWYSRCAAWPRAWHGRQISDNSLRSAAWRCWPSPRPRRAAARRPRAPSPTQTSRSSADRPSSCPPGRRRLLHSAAQEPAPDGSPTPLAGRVARRHSREPPGRPLLLRRPGTGSRHNPVGRPVDSSCGPARVVIIRAFGHGGTSPTTGASWPAAQPDPPAHGDVLISARHPNGHEGRPP